MTHGIPDLMGDLWDIEVSLRILARERAKDSLSAKDDWGAGHSDGRSKAYYLAAIMIRETLEKYDAKDR